ncbi:MAG TPA: cache domain-containing protein, partial [Aggregatilineales bacterium]|nr:cache domain-containing protein [Aggregatilineales bacterium]
MTNPPHEAHLPSSVDSPEWRVSRRQRLLSIQNKIIVPYLSITLLVAGVGTYIVTRLVAGSLQERLSNQLVESGRVAADSIVRSETQHLETLRLMTFSSGVDPAIQEKDTVFLEAVINSLADNADIPAAAVLDSNGNVIAARGSLAGGQFNFQEWESVQNVLNQQQDERGDKFGEMLLEDTPVTLFTISAPVYSSEEPLESPAGIIIVATPLSDLLPTIKREALADVIFYDMNGKIASTTFILGDNDRGSMELTSEIIKSELELLTTQEQSSALAVQVNDRTYQGIYVPLNVRGETFGLIGVYLPDEFIVLAGGTSARIFAGLFTGAAFLIIMIGLLVASTIITPVRQLVSVAQDVTDGDLSQRSRLSARDEIGFLGFTFDIMTHRLEERTLQLEAEAA